MLDKVETFLKGAAMGAADLIPGISGGTIAFITGIYAHLITCIKRINPSLYVYHKNHGTQQTLQYIDVPFLATLGLGILTSIIIMSRLVHYLLSYQSVPLSGFFAGLIGTSAILMIKELKSFDLAHKLTIVIGCILGLMLSFMSPSQEAPTHLMIFIGGILAASAMILPGISGSFILLLMGLYSPVLEAVYTFNFQIIGLLGLGAIVGLICFVQVVAVLLEEAHDITFSLLIGLMLGCLYKMWPWKTHQILIEGSEVNFVETIVSPSIFTKVTGELPDVGAVLLAVILGMIVALALQKNTKNTM